LHFLEIHRLCTLQKDGRSLKTVSILLLFYSLNPAPQNCSERKKVFYLQGKKRVGLLNFTYFIFVKMHGTTILHDPRHITTPLHTIANSQYYLSLNRFVCLRKLKFTGVMTAAAGRREKIPCRLWGV